MTYLLEGVVRFEIPLRLSGIFCNRERYLKYSTTIPVISVDFPFMQVDDLLRQRKTDAGFSAFAHVKAVEDVRQVRRSSLRA